MGDQPTGPKIIRFQRRLRSLSEFERKHRLPELDWDYAKGKKRAKRDPFARPGAADYPSSDEQGSQSDKPSRPLSRMITVLKFWRAKKRDPRK